MRVTRLDSSDYRRMPWKNGLGVTTEIARAPQDGDFEWRVSVADVKTDGPFSSFPGCDRVILTLEGAGMLLTHSDRDGERTFLSAAAGHSCPAADPEINAISGRTGMSGRSGQECPLSAAPHSHAVLGLLEPWTFSGDWTTTCALRNGPIRDFNVIARRAVWTPRVTVLRVEREMNMEVTAAMVLLYCVTGSAAIDAGELVGLERDCTLMLQPAAGEEPQLVVRPSGAQAILISVELWHR